MSYDVRVHVFVVVFFLSDFVFSLSFLQLSVYSWCTYFVLAIILDIFHWASVG